MSEALLPLFPLEDARRVVVGALEEDLGAGGDVTSAALVPKGTLGEGLLVAREALVVAGLPLAPLVVEEAARRVGGSVRVALLAGEGRRVEAGEPLARVEGEGWPLLAGERVLLNLVGRLSGIATLTAECVAEVEGTRARIADTRKTTPLLRALEKYAVAVGGGENHRFGLHDLILAKDNHKELLGGIPALIERLIEGGHPLDALEVEVDSLDEFSVALHAGVGFILLDNMSVDEVRECARLAAGRARLEVSGGLRPGSLRPYAEAGVDRLSLGLLTHGARSRDVALDLSLRPAP